MQCSAVSIVNFEQANTEWIYFNVGSIEIKENAE